MLRKIGAILLLLASSVTVAEEEMVQQILEPTGGKIMKPKSWFYSESQNSNGYMWTLSEEDISSGGSYDTGVRIQLMSGIKTGTGKTPKEFLFDFMESKKAAVDRVISTCPEADQGLFSVVCLETVETALHEKSEKKHHILYSLFWSNSMDLVVISIAGARESEWSNYESIFNEMRGFELIDMSRFEKP